MAYFVEDASTLRDGACAVGIGLLAGCHPHHLVLVRVEDIRSSHGHAEGSERVLDANRAFVRGEDVLEVLVDLGRLVGSAADHHDALVAQALLHGGPVDESLADHRLRAQLARARARVARAALPVVLPRRNGEVAVALGALVDGAALDATRGLGATHHTARSVYRRAKRLLRVLALHPLEDHRVVAHRRADEALPARLRRGAALADHPVGTPRVLFAPSEVVVVVHLVYGAGAEDREHLVHHHVAASVCVAAGELHRLDVVLTDLRVDLEQHGRRVHLTLAHLHPAALALLVVERQPLRDGEEPGRGLVTESARPEMDPHPHRVLLVGEEVHVVVAGAAAWFGEALRL